MCADFRRVCESMEGRAEEEQKEEGVWYLVVHQGLRIIKCDTPLRVSFCFSQSTPQNFTSKFSRFLLTEQKHTSNRLHHSTQLCIKKTQSNMEISPETHSVGILAARLASTIQGFDDYERNQLQQVQQQLVVKAAQEPIPGFFCESIVAIDTIDWKVGKQFLESEALVLVRRSDKE
jgi:hypothetical protein